MLVALFLSLFALAQAQVTDCGAGKTVFSINSQGFSPLPPIPGQDATLWIDYTVPSETLIDAGTAKYTFTLNGIPFPASTEDLCTQITCPQVTGTYNITTVSAWPSGLSGKITSKIQWYDENNQELLCSQLTVKSSLKAPHNNLRGAVTQG
jgi:hypothetical protein